jgi:hypothetical protein
VNPHGWNCEFLISESMVQIKSSSIESMITLYVDGLIVRSHILIVWSRDAEASHGITGDQFIDQIVASWSPSDNMGRPVATSQALTVMSRDPDVSIFPSGDQATDQTLSLWPVNVLEHRSVAISQIFIVQSTDAEATCVPVGDQDTEEPNQCVPVGDQDTEEPNQCVPQALTNNFLSLYPRP